MGHRSRVTIPEGTIIDDYEISIILGQGGFGDVYLVRNRESGKIFALKTEYLDAEKRAMENELRILSAVTGPYVPHVYSRGQTDNCQYFVMEVLGPSLSVCRSKQPRKAFSKNMVLLIAEETLHIIQKVHEQGIIHRDVKPSNFLTRPHGEYPLCLVDFGISKIHIEKGSRKPVPQGEGRFVGTSKYASPNAFRKLDLGRVDDIWSWWYMICELGTGKLPWSGMKDKEEVLRMKETVRVVELTYGLPSVFASILGVFKDLVYADKPDYQTMFRMMREWRETEGVYYEGSEWRWLWQLDREATERVPRVPGDEMFDTFNPDDDKWASSRGGCCAVS
jgi:serine/threonine protein kinase